MELSVKDYSELVGITIQGVYKRIKKGSVQTVTKDGKRLVVVHSADIKQVAEPVAKQDSNKFLKKLVKKLNRKIDKKDNIIQELNQSLKECAKSKEDVLLKYIEELKQLKQIAPPVETIDIKPKKKKKKKK